MTPPTDNERDSPNAIARLGQLSVPELIRLHRSSLTELRRRGVVRTMNSPQGDWAESLVAVAYAGELAANSEKSWDVRADGGRRLQVKARVLPTGKVGAKITSPFRSWDFDAAVIVLFDDDLMVIAASELATDTVRQLSTYRKHVNGHVLRPTHANLAHGADITARLQAAAHTM